MSLINIYLYLNRFIHNYRLIKVSNVSHETNLISSIYFNPYFHISLNCFHNSNKSTQNIHLFNKYLILEKTFLMKHFNRNFHQYFLSYKTKLLLILQTIKKILFK